MKYTELKGVPVFNTGTHRGEQYDALRLLRMVKNSNLARRYFRGVLKAKLSHDDELQPTLLSKAALGQNVVYYLKPGSGGPFVMADFSGVPEPVAQAAPVHFPNISVEKYRVFDSGDGFRAPDVIKSVAFLGADAPEVKGLKQAYPDLFRDTCGEVERFEMEEFMGELIKAWRESLGLSVADLAGIVGATPDDIEAIESGQEPSDEMLAKIAEAFGLSAADLKAGKMPEKADEAPAQFSEADVQRMIAAAVQKAVAPLQKQVGELAEKAMSAEERAQKKEAELYAERKAAKVKGIKAKIDGWKQKGMPAVLEGMGLQAFMERLDDQAVEQFGEGGEQLAPAAWFERFVEKFQDVGSVPIGELTGQAYQRGDADDDNALVEQYAEEHQLRYADAASALSRQGKIKR